MSKLRDFIVRFPRHHVELRVNGCENEKAAIDAAIKHHGLEGIDLEYTRNVPTCHAAPPEEPKPVQAAGPKDTIVAATGRKAIEENTGVVPVSAGGSTPEKK